MERPIEGPEPYTPRLSSYEGGQWIGKVSGDEFDKLMALHLPTVRPMYVGKKKLWAWLDVAILGYLLQRCGLGEDPVAEKKPAAGKSGES